MRRTKKLSIDEINERLYSLYGDVVKLDEKTYKNISEKCNFIDIKYGGWLATPKNVLCGYGHKQRYYDSRKGKSILPLSELKDKIKKVWGNTVVIDESSFVNTKTKCRFVDVDFGEFFMTPNHVYRGSGNKKRSIHNQILNRTKDIDILKKEIYNVWGDIIQIKDDTYICNGKPATFIHKIHGEWLAIPNNIIRGHGHQKDAINKAIQTFFRNYGESHPMRNEKFFYNHNKSKKNVIMIEHWKTGKLLICSGSLEYAILGKLNNDKVDYDWQIKIKLDNDIIYYCDLYLKKDDLYVEIKGVFRSDNSRLKWEEFHQKYKNSEIWYRPKIKEYTGKTEHSLRKEWTDAKK